MIKTILFIGLCLMASGCATQKVVDREPAFHFEMPTSGVTCNFIETDRGDYDCVKGTL